MRLLLFLLLFTTPVFGTETYTLTLKVKSLGLQKAMDKVKIIGVSKDGNVYEGETDSTGLAIFGNIKDKHLTFTLIANDSLHREYVLQIDNKPKYDLSKTVSMHYSREIEKTMLDARRSTSVKKDSSQNVAKELFCSEDFVEAEYPGGYAGMMDFITSNMEFPQSAIEYGIKGTVYVSFSVETDGSVKNIKLRRGLSEDCDRAAMMILCYMPNWTPATCGGEKERCYFQLPLTFSYE